MFMLRTGIPLLCGLWPGDAQHQGLRVLSGETEAVWQEGRETRALWEVTSSVGMRCGQTEMLPLHTRYPGNSVEQGCFGGGSLAACSKERGEELLTLL